jgi:adenylate cyclase
VAVHRLGDDAVMAGEPPLEIVVALHVGTVIYGNIGAADRLDFTVIGLAVNLVSRVETVAKALNLPIVVIDEFARAVRRAAAFAGNSSPPRSGHAARVVHAGHQRSIHRSVIGSGTVH